MEFAPLKCCYFNAQGLLVKYAELFDFVEIEKPDILAISETFLAATVNDSELSIPGYILFRKDRNLDFYNGIYSQETRGGVLAYVKGDLHPTISEVNSVRAELLWLNIYPSITLHMLLGVCYRPELAGHDYVETLCDSFNQVQVNDCIIVGDFNFRDIDWEDIEGHSPSSRLFVQCLQDNYMTQLVEEPTRNKYINDLVITSNADLIDSVIVNDAFPYTDPKTLTMNVKLFIPKISKKQRKVYLYSKGRYAEFNRAVSEFDWQGTLARYESMEQKWAMFKHTLFLFQDEYIPSKSLKLGTRSRFPWLNNPKVKHERKMKRKAQVKANISGLYSDTVLSQAANTQYRAQLLRSKVEYEASLASEIRENPRRFYNYCRNFTRSGATIESLKVNGATITHDHDKANALNEFFASVMVKEPDELPYIPSNDEPKDILEIIEFSSKDIFDLLLQVDPNKAKAQTKYTREYFAKYQRYVNRFIYYSDFRLKVHSYREIRLQQTYAHYIKKEAELVQITIVQLASRVRW